MKEGRKEEGVPSLRPLLSPSQFSPVAHRRSPCGWRPICEHAYLPQSLNGPVGQGESGWCLDMTSTHGVWRHTEVEFLLLGAISFSISFGDVAPHATCTPRSWLSFPGSTWWSCGCVCGCGCGCG